MTDKIIRVATDFSRVPGGRYIEHGPFSGEQFREEHLVPALNTSDHVTVLLDGAAGYPSSFLEEAFGGLVRARGFRADDLARRLTVQADDPKYSTYVLLADKYIREARPAAA